MVIIVMSENKSVPFEKLSVFTETLFSKEPSATQLYTDKFVEIDLVVSGGGIHHVLDRAIPCKEGEICVICPNTPHGYETEEGENATILRILFDPKTFLNGDYGASYNEKFCYGVFCEGTTVSYATLDKKSRNDIEPLLLEIFDEVETKNAGWEVVVSSYLSILLVNLSRYMKGAIRNPSAVSERDRELNCAVMRILNDEFSLENTTLESVAERVYISPAQLSRIFKKFTGETFSDYLRKLRMAHGCHLLKDTNLTVGQILEACGLRDLHSFYRSFNSYTGMTPNQYRTKYKKQFIEKEDKIMVIMSEISENLQKGKSKIVKELVQQAIDEGCNPATILNEGLLSGMNVIGEKFKNNEVFVPEVLVAARAMNAGIALLKPLLATEGVEAKGKVCIGTVQGDLHDIGKNLVKMMMEGKGLEVIDLGTDVSPEAFVNAVKEHGCQVVCCSALLTTTMDVMGEVVKAFTEAGLRDKVKIMIGGAPVNEEFCREIGADCYTVDAASASDAAVELCQAK